MSEQSRSPPTHFFTLRLWLEKMEDDESVWRGRIQYSASGEVRYFQGWDALVELVQLLISEKK